jgi:hypothetical protein
MDTAEALLYERCLTQTARDLSDELHRAVAMLDRTTCPQARKETYLYADQITSEISDIAKRLTDLRSRG